MSNAAAYFDSPDPRQVSRGGPPGKISLARNLEAVWDSHEWFSAWYPLRWSKKKALKRLKCEILWCLVWWWVLITDRCNTPELMHCAVGLHSGRGFYMGWDFFFSLSCPASTPLGTFFRDKCGYSRSTAFLFPHFYLWQRTKAYWFSTLPCSMVFTRLGLMSGDMCQTHPLDHSLRNLSSSHLCSICTWLNRLAFHDWWVAKEFAHHPSMPPAVFLMPYRC